jgi:hypothetical protein
MFAFPNSSASPNIETNLPIFNPSSPIHLTKLTRLNYPTWKATMSPYLKGKKYQLMIFGKLKIILFLAASTLLSLMKYLPKLLIVAPPLLFGCLSALLLHHSLVLK